MQDPGNCIFHYSIFIKRFFCSLFSYAKYLELLIYSPLICALTPPLCEHTTPPPPPWNSLPSSRLNVVRHFTTDTADISFALSTIDVFELRVPRLQIIQGVDNSSPFNSIGTTNLTDAMDEKRALRMEIRKWWEGVSDHMDRTVRHIFCICVFHLCRAGKCTSSKRSASEETATPFALS